MRALICKTFGGYTFDRVDQLDCEDFAEVGGSALWLLDEEKKSTPKSKSHKRRR